MPDAHTLHNQCHQLAQYRDRVHQCRKRMDRVLRAIRLSMGGAPVAQLVAEREEVMREVTYLLSNTPLQLHKNLGDEVFADLHQDLGSAVALSEREPLDTIAIGLRWERLSISVALAVYVLGVLDESLRLVATGFEIGYSRAAERRAQWPSP